MSIFQSGRGALLALLAANAISELGNVLTILAIPWFVLQTTGSASQTGMAGFFGALPLLLAGFFGGPLVDRLGFKRVSIGADVASGITVALIPLLYYTSGIAFWQLLTLVFLGALLDTPGATARMSLLPELAQTAGVTLERANAVYQGTRRLASFVAPVAAGFLITAFGTSRVLWIDAATFAISALLVAVFVSQGVGSSGEAGNDGYLSELAAGLRLLRTHHLLLPLVAAISIANGLLNSFLGVGLPVFADSVYGQAVDLGVLAAGWGGGTLGGALAFGAIGHLIPRRVTLVGGFLFTGLPFAVLALTPPLLPAFGALLVVGMAAGFVAPLVATLVQESTPAAMRGRIFSLLTAVTSAATPIGMFGVGYLLEHADLSTYLLLLAVAFLVITGLLFYSLKALSGELKYSA
jgi:MFS family permease